MTFAWRPLGIALPAVLASGLALAQGDYPSRPVRIVVGVGAGAPGDIGARVLAGALALLPDFTVAYAASAKPEASYPNKPVRLMRSPEVKERLFNTGMEVVGSSPQELGAALKSEMARMGKVIRAVGIREE